MQITCYQCATRIPLETTASQVFCPSCGQLNLTSPSPSQTGRTSQAPTGRVPQSPVALAVPQATLTKKKPRLGRFLALLLLVGGGGLLAYLLVTKDAQEDALPSDEATLAIAAIRFRQLAAFNFPKAVKSYGASEVFKPIENHPVTKKSPATWSLFFSGALTLVGRAQSDAPVFAYYNPLFDSALISVWGEKDKKPQLLSISIRQGRDLAGYQPGSSNEPKIARWLTSDKSMQQSLSAEVASVVDQFENMYQEENTGETQAEKVTVHESSTGSGLGRLETQLHFALSQLAAIYDPLDSHLGAVLRTMLEVLRTQDAEAISSILPKNNPLSASDILKIPAEARENLVPTYSLFSESTLLVMFVSADVPSVYGVYEFSRGTKNGKPSAEPVSLTFFSLDTQETP